VQTAPMVWVDDERAQLQPARPGIGAATQRRKLPKALDGAVRLTRCNHEAVRLQAQRVHPASATCTGSQRLQVLYVSGLCSPPSITQDPEGGCQAQCANQPAHGSRQTIQQGICCHLSRSSALKMAGMSSPVAWRNCIPAVSKPAAETAACCTLMHAGFAVNRLGSMCKCGCSLPGCSCTARHLQTAHNRVARRGATLELKHWRSSVTCMLRAALTTCPAAAL
jgi:hypothetical protein